MRTKLGRKRDRELKGRRGRNMWRGKNRWREMYKRKRGEEKRGEEGETGFEKVGKDLGKSKIFFFTSVILSKS